MMGCSSSEGRCSSSLSRQRLTVTLLQAMTKMGMTGWVGTAALALDLLEGLHRDWWLRICRRISFCVSSSAAMLSAISSTSPITSPVGFAAAAASACSGRGLSSWDSVGLPHSRNNRMAFQVMSRKVPKRIRDPCLRNMAHKFL